MAKNEPTYDENADEIICTLSNDEGTLHGHGRAPLTSENPRAEALARATAELARHEQIDQERAANNA